VDGAQAGETDEMDEMVADETAEGLPPPQAVSQRRSEVTTKLHASGLFTDTLPFLFLRRGLYLLRYAFEAAQGNRGGSSNTCYPLRTGEGWYASFYFE
jgi:hypothetical protein